MLILDTIAIPRIQIGILSIPIIYYITVFLIHCFISGFVTLNVTIGVIRRAKSKRISIKKSPGGRRAVQVIGKSLRRKSNFVEVFIQSGTHS